MSGDDLLMSNELNGWKIGADVSMIIYFSRFRRTSSLGVVIVNSITIYDNGALVLRIPS